MRLPPSVVALALLAVCCFTCCTQTASAEPPFVYDPYYWGDDPDAPKPPPPQQELSVSVPLSEGPAAEPEDELSRQWDTSQVPIGNPVESPTPPQQLKPQGVLAEQWLKKMNALHPKGEKASPSAGTAHLYRVKEPSHWAQAGNRFMFVNVPTTFDPAFREDGAFELRSNLGSLALIGTAPGIRRFLTRGSELLVRNATQPGESGAISVRIAELKARTLQWLDPWGTTIEMVALDFASIMEPVIPYLMASPPIVADAVPGFRQAKIFNKCELRKKPGVVRFLVGIVKFLTWIRDDKAPCLDERHFGVFINLGGDGTPLPSSGPGQQVRLGAARYPIFKALEGALSRSS